MTAVWFDLDGTLVEFTRPYGAILTDVFREHLGPLERDAERSGDEPPEGAAESLAATYDEAFFSAFEALEDRPYRAAMAAVVDAAAGLDGLDGMDAEGVDAPGAGPASADPAAMVETLREREYAATAVDDAARDALAGLAEDERLGVLTNGVGDWQRGKLAHHGLVELFDAVVVSYEAGAHKPEPAPFDLARERIDADDHVLVGDDDADVEGARAAGFVPVRFEQPPDGPNFWETLDALL